MTINWNKLKTADSIRAEKELAQTEYLFSENNKKYEEATLALTKNYPPLEKDTWPTQEKEATGWLVDQNTPTPWIDLASTERGIPRLEYIKRTLIKIDQFKLSAAFLTGRRQKYEDMINDNQTPEFDYVFTNELYQSLLDIKNQYEQSPLFNVEV